MQNKCTKINLTYLLYIVIYLFIHLYKILASVEFRKSFWKTLKWSQFDKEIHTENSPLSFWRSLLSHQTSTSTLLCHPTSWIASTNHWLYLVAYEHSSQETRLGFMRMVRTEKPYISSWGFLFHCALCCQPFWSTFALFYMKLPAGLTLN